MVRRMSNDGLDTHFLDAVSSAFSDDGVRFIPGLRFDNRGFPSQESLVYVRKNFDSHNKASRATARVIYDHLQKLYGAEYSHGKGINP